MSKQFLALVSFVFLALLYTGAFSQSSSHGSVFTHIAYAQGDMGGGGMGGSSCDAGGGGMGGASCDTGNGTGGTGGNDGDTPYTPVDPPTDPPIDPVGEVAGTLTLTKNPCAIAAGATTCQPYFDWATTNTDPSNAGTVSFNIINTDGNGTYASEVSYAYSHKTTGADGRGVALAAGTYTIKLYGFKSNDWVLLDSKTQTVTSNAPTTPTGTLTLTENPCAIAAGETRCQPYFDWTTVNTELGSAGRVAFNIRDVSWAGTYANETSYADSSAASGTDGAGVPLPEGIYIIKLYGFKSNDWVLLDSKTQTVTSNDAAPTGTLTLKTNPCVIAAGQTACQPYFDWTTANTYQGSDGRVVFNIINNAGTAPYTADTRYAGSNAASGTDGAGAVLAAGTYTVKLYGFSLSANTWVLLDSETQVVNTTSPDLTVSGITPTSAIAGTATTFSATISNTGAGSTGIGFKNFYQVKSGTVGYTPHNLFAKLFNIAHAAETITDLAATTMSALAAGGNGTATQSYTFPAAGTYGVRVCADKENSAGTNGNPNGLIAESDETNNCGGWTNVNVVAACTPGAACSASNACNYATGTYDSSCNCSATVPPEPPDFGDVCPSDPPKNVCDQPGSGTILCNGTCSAVTPPDTQCYPTVSLSADPTRVRKDTSTKLTWTSSSATSCLLTGQNGLNYTIPNASLSSGDRDSTAIDAQTTFTLSCSNTYGSKSASVIVNVLPSYIEQ